MSWVFVCHVHTHRSPDCMTSPAALVRRAVKLGVDVLAVTDHDTWQGAVEALGVVSGAGLKLRIVIASEVATDQGDVIGLFLRDDVRTRPAAEFCDQVHAQAGLVYLPHPFKWHRLDDELLRRVDLIEVHNARTSPADNARAAALAHERGLPALVGPDAHRLGELWLARNEFDGDVPADEAGLKRALLEAPRRHVTARASIWNEWRSQVVKLVKQPEAELAWRLARGAVRRVVKPKDYVVG
jgi:predicted metal-dependent phosphoesterase TrpH